MPQHTKVRPLGRWLGILGPDASQKRSPEWRLDYLFSIGVQSWIIHLSVICLAGFVLVGAGVGAWVPAWIVVMVMLSLAMVALAIAYRRRTVSSSPRTYGIAHSLLTGLVGLAWGCGAVLCAVSSSAGMLTFYTLVLGGTALGAVSSQHVLMCSCMVSLWTSIPLLAISWLVNGTGPGPLATATIMVLFGVMLSVLAIRMNDFVVQNVTLADELAAKNAVLTRTSAQLAEAHEEKSRFLAQASHDLRQPIHAIGLFVEYLGGMRLGRDGREVLANIDRSLESLTRLCRSLLDLSALDVGRVKPQLGAVSLGDVTAEVVRQASAAARARDITLRFRPSRLWARSDEALLHTMVQNLVSNAIKYAPGATVLVGVRRRYGALAIVVADTGPGIGKADQRRIFQEFVRINAPHSEETEGLGLGLSIVRRLADMLDLKVTLVSRPGQGACFAIEGLVETPPDLRRRRLPANRHAKRLHGLRVLVVDDDRPVRDSTVQLLSRWGCDVRASERVDHADTTAFDFVLCDQELGQSYSGLDLIRRIRARSPAPVAAAIVTGGRIDHLMETCKAEGIVILAKPVRPAQLRSALLAGLAAQTNPNSEAIPAAADRVGTSSARNKAET